MKKIDKTLFQDIRLLYVEDDEMTTEEVGFFLKKYFKELYIAKNGEEGLELFKEHNPDMIITDIQMPKMNGLEMCEEIFKINPEVPVAVTTAYSDGEYLIKSIELGIDKYILKPINMLEILAVIQKSLNLGTQNKICNEFEDYLQFILDSNPTFMFIFHSDKLEYANKSFLDLLGHENITSLKEYSKKCEKLFEFENVEVNENWMEYILNNDECKYLVKLNSSNEKYLESRFYVTHKYFESTNKSVFAFVETNEDKLNTIDTIISDLLKVEISDEKILNGLNEISRLIQRK